MRFTIICALSFAVGCSNGGTVKTVHVSAMGKTAALVRAGDRVAYLLNLPTGVGATGDLHVTDTTGKDVEISGGISADGYLFAPDGNSLVYTKMNAGGMDAALYWVDVAHGGSPKQLFANGLRVAANNPSSATSGTHAAPLIQQGFFSPSGKYFVVGVLAPGINSSSDMHVIDLGTGNEVWSRVNGAFAYLELVLPDDTMVFQDSENAVTGVAGPPSVEHLYWVSLPSASGMTATAIDDRVAQFVPTSDNKFIVYQKTNRDLLAWDATAHPAQGTTLATGTVQYGVGSNIVVYSSGDGSLHIVGVDGSKKADVAAAGADPFSPILVSSDGNDIYYFQKVETQNARGTLMHLAPSGGTPSKIDMNASLFDVRPVPGGLLYLRNVDAMGKLADLVRAARDGSGGSALATGVPVGINILDIQGKDQNWVAPHLASAALNPMQTLIDGTSGTTGTLSLATMSGDTKIETQTRLGDYALDSNDNQSLVFIGGLKLDSTQNNYVGSLKWVPTGMPSMMPSAIMLDSVTEMTPVSKRGFFANSISAMTPPGVYYVTY